MTLTRSLLSVLLMDRYNVFDGLQAHSFVLYVHLNSFTTDVEDNSLKLTMRSCTEGLHRENLHPDNSFLRGDSSHRPLCGPSWMARSTWSRVCDRE